MTQRVRGRHQDFYISNKDRIFKNKLPVTNRGSGIPDEGAAVMETGPPTVSTKASSLKVSPSTFCSAGANCPSARLSPSVVNDRGQHTKPRHQREKKGPRLGEGLG